MSTPPQSPLYKTAVAALGTKHRQWRTAAKYLRNIKAPVLDKKNASGTAVLQMIQTEHQLSPDPGKPDPVWLLDFLERLCALSWTGNAVHDKPAFESTRDDFLLRGPLIKVDPKNLYRYVNGPGIFFAISDTLSTSSDPSDKKIGRALRSRIRSAEKGDRITWSQVLAYVQHPSCWNAVQRDLVYLSGQRSTFVTFDPPTPDPMVRRKASRAHAALALWKPCSSCFIEVTYEKLGSDELRFPTFADAGWSRFFKSVTVTELHGWTRPHGGKLPPQPEAVQDHPTLARVDRPSDMRLLPI